ncbi:phosphatidylinositol mannoside acyltransferase [Actinophytocola gossypii]|uniref:Phosphatidylinositol mannoside acyltransferase n=1 Tax=Actinophytocola gossypii TaxID=2812003 RepID=A0ABT2J6P4_9PSEU|nr:phosphatidylinositol mannoside acyltransferase [Actinophytocola gossypii]MCT2583165.1 phosphatidylinositol mannoside acyltransferase [Actinophytocola gossypii]
MSIGERLADLGYAAGWGLVRGLPAPLARGAFRAGADLAVRRGGPGVSQLRRNYARVVPQAGRAELDELVRDGVRSYARYWMETFRLPGMDRRAVYEQVDEVMVGKPLVDAALERGKGLILALPHTGNFDVSGVWLVGHSGRFTTVNERLRPESLYQRFVSYRESLGFEILAASGTDVGPYRVLMERLRQNRVVCLLADRDLSKRGIPVDFFGAKTRMPAGPARLAATTGAQILVVDNTFTEDGWGLRMHTPILVHGRDEVASATQRIADGFAADIGANPVDWHMMQKLWIEDLSDERRAALTEPEGAAESR